MSRNWHRVSSLIAPLISVSSALCPSGCTERAPSETAFAPDAAADASVRDPNASSRLDASHEIAGDASIDASVDAGPGRRLRVGVNLGAFEEPTDDAGVRSANDSLLSEIEILALGIEATHLPDSEVVELRERASRFAARDVSVAVSVDIVSGRRSLLGAAQLDVSRFEQQLDLLLGEPLDAEYLIVGAALDLYRNEAEVEEKAAFTAFVTEALRLAKEHPAKPKTMRVGLNTRLSSWLGATAFRAPEEWLLAADVISVTWLPLDENGIARAPAEYASQLRDFLAQAPQLGRPVVLQVAYPSATSAGSSLSLQADFYADLFAGVAGASSAVDALTISALDDPPTSTCARAGEDLGPAAPKSFTEAWCSTGLRARDSTPKPAYFSVIEGLARFSSR